MLSVEHFYELTRELLSYGNIKHRVSPRPLLSIHRSPMNWAINVRMLT